MIISLIGMSGSGKSHWSKKLQTQDFKRFCCDDLIEEKLGDELKKLGYSGIRDVSKWMGQPFDPQYKRTSKKYLQFEKDVLEEVITAVKNSSESENIVIDTTGSVIYMSKEILQTLTQLTKVIYFEIPALVKEKMYQLYLQDPKPVIWGSTFKKDGNEDNLEALAKCYPKLLASRSKKYEKLAHITLDYHKLRHNNFTTEMFLQALR